uniref:Indole-3-glycerol phosphate synthase n=1 Tax=Chlorobium chlorochromatii (strain CaD3) TaxID=340177 RepID=TRPC_CHLCH|nr:RecName: Full=Indole-3-glycerol phosphate synthase; Short=IGPS [Chlorobium chlorochromatii CaD3]
MTYLDRILEHKQIEVAALKKEQPRQRYEELQAELEAPRNFSASLKRPANKGVRLIAEIKKASPSRGLIVQDFDPLAMAQRYQELGAAAFSVLTDQQFFQGSNDYLRQVKGAFKLPVLRKDFIVDALQIFEARLLGADAILLIVAALESSQLRDYLQLSAELGLSALVEVHDGAELDEALQQGATILGVNNRNLKDFSVDINTSIKLRPSIPSDMIAVAESGLKRAADIDAVNAAGFDAVLIGEGLHISTELRSLIWT